MTETCKHVKGGFSMDFLELAAKRYSLRQFSPRKVEKEKIDRILEAGRLAPTACNNQPQRILVLESEETLEKLKKCTPCHFNAPLAFLVCYDNRQSWKRSYDGKEFGDIDASIVGTHLMMEAADLGLGTTWVGYFDPEAVVREFALPDYIVPVALFPAGYPAENAAPNREQHFSRKPLEQTVSYNHL